MPGFEPEPGDPQTPMLTTTLHGPLHIVIIYYWVIKFIKEWGIF